MRLMTAATKHYKSVILGSSLAIMAGLPAHAIDRMQVLQLLNAQLPADTVQIRDADIAIDGDDVTVTNIRFGLIDDPTGRVYVERIVLQDVQEHSDNTYKVGKVAVPQFRYSSTDDGNQQIVMQDLSGDNLILTTTPFLEKIESNFAETFSFYEMFETFSIAHFEVTFADIKAFSFDNLSFQNNVSDGNYDMIAKIEDFSFPVKEFYDLVEDAGAMSDDYEMFKVLVDLGYDDFSGAVYSDMKWNANTGVLRINNYDLTMKNGFTLSTKASIDGFTGEVYRSLEELGMQEEAGTLSEQDAAIKGLAIMQKIIFNSFEISYTDDGLTDKVMDYLAEQNSVSRQDLINQAKFIATMGLMQLGDQQFAADVTAQIETFLTDPESLRLTIAPEQPSSVAVIVAYAMSSSPQALVQFLNTKVIANE